MGNSDSANNIPYHFTYENKYLDNILDKYKTVIGILLGFEPSKIEFITYVKDACDWVPLGGLYYPTDKDYQERNGFCLTEVWVIHNPEGKPAKEVVGMNGDYFISKFKLYEMPHCCGIMVSCQAYINTIYRNKKVGTALNLMRQDLGRMLDYTVMLCTDIESNEHQRKLLAKQGFQDIYKFSNKRTNNDVFVSVKLL